MVLVVPKKFLEGVWWKYGLLLVGLQLSCWILLGFKLNPELKISMVVATSYVVYSTFIVAAFLPFTLGRLQLKRLAWLSLAGFLLADAAYFMLALYEPARRLNHLLPFIAFVQTYIALFSLGVLIELGHYVYKKVFEE